MVWCQCAHGWRYIATLPTLGWEIQCIFTLEAFACILFWQFYLRHNPETSDGPLLNQRNAQYIGRQITLTEPIVNHRGRVRLDDSFWKSKAIPQQALQLK